MDRDILFVNPVFKQAIWGGERLKTEWHYDVPGPKTGECWGISANPEGDCVVDSRFYGGKKLSTLWNEHRELFGYSDKDRFPLLVKIIDPGDDLSIQVHPDDDYAGIHENGSLGKTECWYVLDAPENASLVIGTNARDKESLTEMITENRWNDLIKREPIKKGDFIQIEPGTVHAITRGVEVLETQQNSDITYRVYDYDRLKDGKPRELHVSKSIDVIDTRAGGRKIKVAGNLPKNRMNRLVSCSKYTVWKTEVDGAFSFDMNKKYMLMSVVEGAGRINGIEIKKGMHFILPYKYGKTSLEGKMTIISSIEK